MKQFSFYLELDPQVKEEEELIWWLEQAKNPSALVKRILLGGGIPPWAVKGPKDLQPDTSKNSLMEAEEDLVTKSSWPNLLDLDCTDEENEPDPEKVKQDLMNAFG